LSDGYLHIRHGKGGYQRVVPLLGEAKLCLREYLKFCRPHFATGKMVKSGRDLGLHREALWLSKEGSRWGAQSLRMMCQNYAREAGIPKSVSPHVLRHSCATHLLQGGADIRHIQALLGHKKLTTTQRYTHLRTADLKAVISRYHPRSSFGEMTNE